MFLKNDRGLGIKNGSLGIVERVDSRSVAVRLYAGRTITFDLTDYAHIDHGYAATIHKAQGVTVDRVHVLATPGLDRHAAYVALSRHREAVSLHYGRHDFADDDRLSRVLSRERAKDMASDYMHEDQVSGRAKPELAKYLPQHAPSPQPHHNRSIFAAFRPNALGREEVVTNTADDHAPSSELQQAVRRFARSALDIARMEDRKLEVLPHQVQAHERARVALDAVRPHASQDLANAIARDPALGQQAAIGRTRAAIRAMQMEGEIRTNPKLRADRFVAGWQSLVQERLRFDRSGDWQSERKIRNAMGDLAKSLNRDPQFESILRNRVRELGIPMDWGRGIGHYLLDSLGLGRGRGLSL
jgi:Viral (Superfamily 1) RNA helicase